MLPLRLIVLGEQCSEKDGFCSMENDSAQVSLIVAVPSFLSSESRAPDSPQVSLVHSVFPLSALRVSGCKRNFVRWTFKRLSASLAVSSRQTEPLLLFKAGCYLGSFMALVLYAEEPSLGFGCHTSQEQPLGH